MKKKFSPSWIASKQVRKQRKYRANAPLHTRHKFLSAHLSGTLRKNHDKRSFPVRKGDEVLVMRGSFKKKRAKIASVDLIRSRVTLENIQRTKKDGTKVNVYFSPSSLQIQSMNLEDKARIKALNKGKKKSQASPKPKEQTSSKPKDQTTQKPKESTSKPKEEKNVSDKSKSN